MPAGRARDRQAKYGRHDGQTAEQQQSQRGVGAGAVFVAGAIALGDDDAVAGRNAQGDRQEKKHKTASRPNGGKGGLAGKTPHDDHVGRIVKLLQQRAGEHGKRESQRVPPRRPFRHRYALKFCHRSVAFLS